MIVSHAFQRRMIHDFHPKRLRSSSSSRPSAVIWRSRRRSRCCRCPGARPTVVHHARIFTGPDGLAHAEYIELKLGGPEAASEMLKATGASSAFEPADRCASPNQHGASSLSDPGCTRAGDNSLD